MATSKKRATAGAVEAEPTPTDEEMRAVIAAIEPPPPALFHVMDKSQFMVDRVIVDPLTGRGYEVKRNFNLYALIANGQIPDSLTAMVNTAAAGGVGGVVGELAKGMDDKGQLTGKEAIQLIRVLVVSAVKSPQLTLFPVPEADQRIFIDDLEQNDMDILAGHVMNRLVDTFRGIRPE